MKRLETEVKLLDSIPRPVKTLLYKVAFLYLIVTVLFRMHLLPLDKINSFLTHSLGVLVGWIMQLALPSHFLNVKNSFGESQITINGLSNLTICDECNGLNLIALYSGLIFCFPSQIIRIAKYAIGGTLIIYILNLLRCFILSYLTFLKGDSLNDIHHHIFSAIAYSAIIWMWLNLANKTYVIEYRERHNLPAIDSVL